MTHTGVVNSVFGANVPDTDQPAQKVIVNVARSDLSPKGRTPTFEAYQPQVAFFIPLGPAPDIGIPISWGPHHVEWAGQRVDKLSWEMAP